MAVAPANSIDAQLPLDSAHNKHNNPKQAAMYHTLAYHHQTPSSNPSPEKTISPNFPSSKHCVQAPKTQTPTTPPPKTQSTTPHPELPHPWIPLLQHPGSPSVVKQAKTRLCSGTLAAQPRCNNSTNNANYHNYNNPPYYNPLTNNLDHLYFDYYHQKHSNLAHNHPNKSSPSCL
jgi:hypothetical protein